MNISTATETINLFHGSVMGALANAMRGFLIAKSGYEFIAGDWAAIESRMLNWLAGQEDILELYRGDGKIYEFNAGSIFSVSPSLITKHDWRRQIGKVAELAFGYQGGVGAMQTMAKTYNVQMAPAFTALWNTAPEERRKKAEFAWNRDKKKAGISREEYIASDLAKQAWREQHPKIVEFWQDLEDAAIAAVNNPGVMFGAGAPGRQIKYRMNGSFLWCQLPSTRVICYPYPKIDEFKTPWGALKEGLTYMGVNSTTKKWERQKAYGGLLAENADQGASRCVLTDGMKRVESAGYPIVIHVHDEIVTEVPIGWGSVKELEGLMEVVPIWAKGLPLKAEGWKNLRFRK